MQTFNQTVASAQTLQFNVSGKYFTILLTTLGLNVRFYVGGKKKDLGDIKGLLAGLEVSFSSDDGFDRVEVDTLGADTITIGIGNGQARYNRSQGNVSITNTAGAFTQSRVSLTNVNQQIIAANSLRRYLMVQNNDAGATLRLTLDGSAATALIGFRVPAGGALDLSGFNPTGAINAMMETATAAAANVEIVVA